MTFVNEENRQRRRASKVRTACTTCKKRHVKCGEEKPSCARCKVGNRTCSYELVTMAYQKPKKEAPPSDSDAIQQVAVPIAQPFQGQDLRGLNFFIEKMAMLLDRRVPQLWGTIAPQLASNTPALRHGLVALSGIYEQKVYGTNSKEYSLSSYNTAIRMLLNVRKQPIALVDQLLSCLLFIVIEFLQGNVSMAVELIKVGRRLIYASRQTKKTATQQTILAPVQDTFRRLDAHVLELCHHGLEPDLSFGKCWNLEPEYDLSDALNFTNKTQAIRCLGLLMNKWEVARKPGSLDHASFHKALLQWKKKFDTLKDVDHKTRISRGMWWQECEIMILVRAELEKTAQMFSINNQAWDKYEEKFEEMVEFGEELTSAPDVTFPAFSVCPNITSVMFRTAIRCRSPQIRRRAIEVIKAANSQEGLLKPEWALQITRGVVALEEQGLSVMQGKDIPQARRLRDVSIGWDASAPSALKIKYYIRGKEIVDWLGTDF